MQNVKSSWDVAHVHAYMLLFMNHVPDQALLRRLETTLLHWTSQVGMHGACKGGEAVIFQTLQEVQDIILLASTQTPLVCLFCHNRLGLWSLDACNR